MRAEGIGFAQPRRWAVGVIRQWMRFGEDCAMQLGAWVVSMVLLMGQGTGVRSWSFDDVAGLWTKADAATAFDNFTGVPE